jgi:TRAP-type C4-dicarboxylate transport system substrate-binding protein
MTTTLARCAIFLATLFATAAAAEPITLKLAFFSSDRSAPFKTGIKPFLDAVNSEAKGLVEIQLHPSGALASDIAREPQLVLDGGADLAFIVPGYTPDLFPDNAMIELPGLFRDLREATHVYSRLVAEKALRGYRDFLVIGAYATDPESIHGRLPMASLADLKGMRIRVANEGEAAGLRKLGAVPTQLQLTSVTSAISSGSIDATALSLTPLADFGISRVATHHYFLKTSTVSLALVMNRKVFDGLPKAAQEIIRKYSGMWAADRFAEGYAAYDGKIMEQFRSESKRTVVFPTAADSRRAAAIFKGVRDELVGGDSHFQSLVKAIENEASERPQSE